ncbi:MAG: hypothetical protein GXY44_04315 [Phycisphaerales bacterium]|nr:hypothetical protein [Phycisphaerales bacterium]
MSNITSHPERPRIPIEQSGAAPPSGPGNGILLLLNLRHALIRNHLHELFRRRPLNVIGTISTLLLIWGGLYFLLIFTFEEVQQNVLEGIVAIPLIFTFFFLALTGMLAFSNAIISYGSLFHRPESAYLLASPLHPRDMIIVKYLETLLLSSWSLVLLGLPLMMAIANKLGGNWTFYPMFLGLFLCFIPIPGALGMFLAWAVTMVFPKTPRRVLMVATLALLLVSGLWGWRLADPSNTSSEWLKNFYDRASLVQNAMLPHTWVAKGISHAVSGRAGAAGFYLLVILANALLASFLVVSVVARWFTSAFTRAQCSGTRRSGPPGRVINWIAELLFAYLPYRQRMLATNDLKTFFRDPLQWTQMAILFGLLALYVSNVQRLWTDLLHPGLQVLVAFLNLTAVSLILATFTSRFVFPLVSLESQQLWLLGLLPLPRGRIIMAKFLYALTITLLAGVTVISVSIYRLQLPFSLAAAHLICVIAICIGLCGVSIGMGARMPVFHERNPARIAGGFSGTVSLMCSVVLVVISLVVVAFMSLRVAQIGDGATVTQAMMWGVAGVVLLNVIVSVLALTAGIRHFRRLQC